MRRLVEAEIAAVIDRRQALVGVFRIMNAVIAMAARHQRRDHHLRSHAERFAHEVFLEFRADLDQHAADAVAERERPRQLLRRVALQDMQIGAANAAGADFNQRRLLRNFRPWHVANNRLRAGPVIGANTNLFHKNSSGPSAIVDCCAWANRNLCETGSAANVRAARTCGAVDRLVTPPEVCANLDRGCGVLRDRWTMLAVLVVVRLTMAFQFQSVAAVARLSGTRNPIGLCFTPSLALALPAVRSGECSATGPL